MSAGGQMRIGDVAQKTGVPAKTIRYYEEIGLIERARRARNGYRVYDGRALHELRFIKRAREYGFSIEDTAGLLALWRDSGRSSADVKALAEQHIAQIDRKLRELAEMKGALVHLIHRCHGDHRPDCPILDDLADPADGHEEGSP